MSGCISIHPLPTITVLSGKTALIFRMPSWNWTFPCSTGLYSGDARSVNLIFWSKSLFLKNSTSIAQIGHSESYSKSICWFGVGSTSVEPLLLAEEYSGVGNVANLFILLHLTFNPTVECEHKQMSMRTTSWMKLRFEGNIFSTVYSSSNSSQLNAGGQCPEMRGQRRISQYNHGGQRQSHNEVSYSRTQVVYAIIPKALSSLSF